jgi:hypothetical protein
MSNIDQMPEGEISPASEGWINDPKCDFRRADCILPAIGGAQLVTQSRAEVSVYADFVSGYRAARSPSTPS